MPSSGPDAPSSLCVGFATPQPPELWLLPAGRAHAPVEVHSSPAAQSLTARQKLTHRPLEALHA